MMGANIWVRVIPLKIMIGHPLILPPSFDIMAEVPNFNVLEHGIIHNVDIVLWLEELNRLIV